jgi:hypothetical protein
MIRKQNTFKINQFIVLLVIKILIRAINVIFLLSKQQAKDMSIASLSVEKFLSTIY